jgi:hypothetical protein
METTGMRQLIQTGLDQGLKQGVEEGAQAGAQAAARGPEPSANDVSRFQEGMQGRESAAIQPTAPPAGPAQTSGLGDAILQGLDKMRQTRTDKLEQINTLAGKENMTGQDMFRLQFELVQLNLQQDMTVKAADKTNQGIQTLFKNQ